MSGSYPCRLDCSNAYVSRVVIVGSGGSTGVPRLQCACRKIPCPQCNDAIRNPMSRNRRGNTSLLIQVAINGSLSGRPLNVLVDCGKSFRESGIAVLAPLGISRLDAVILTHDHADACFGIDDLREFTVVPHRGIRPKNAEFKQWPIQMYADERTVNSMQRAFHYLFPSKSGAAPNVKHQYIASLNWNMFQLGDEIPVTLTETQGCGFSSTVTLPVLSIPVPHGGSYLTNGLLVPLSVDKVLLYFSDISAFTEEKHKDVMEKVGPRQVELLLVDALSDNPYFSHMTVEGAIRIVKLIRPRKAYFIGMSHQVDFKEVNERASRELGKVGLCAECGWDGAVVYKSDLCSSHI